MSEHGTRSRYVNDGCRCGACKDDNTAYQARARANRRRRLANSDGSPAHGLVSTYQNWGCRCEPCRQAAAVAMRRQRASR